MITESGFEGPPDDLAPILARAVAGDPAAWRTVVDRYGRRLFALAKSRCKDADTAEDITQSVFATVAVKFSSGQYAEEGKFESWLFRVAMNRIRDHIRKVRRQPVTADSDLVSDSESRSRGSTQDHPDPSAIDRLREAMQALGDTDREVIELRHHGGMSFKQMADVLDEPMGTLLARHHRALRKLKELLEANSTVHHSSTSPTKGSAST